MIKPTIHLNGTSAQSLLDGYEKAYSAMTDAINSLRDCAPNGRDYYPQGTGVIIKADTEHWARIEKIQEVQKEIEALAEHVADSLPAKEPAAL